jgi:hypothetical protein
MGTGKAAHARQNIRQLKLRLNGALTEADREDLRAEIEMWERARDNPENFEWKKAEASHAKE